MGASRALRDLDISRLSGIASPQSPTPFLQARRSYQIREGFSSALGHQTPPWRGSKIPGGSGDWSPEKSPLSSGADG